MRYVKLRWVGLSVLALLLISALAYASLLGRIQYQSEDPAALRFVGTWRVRYTNDAIRTYEVYTDGGVRFPEENRVTQLQGRGEVLVQFDDGKLERWTLAGKRLLVEHWSRASSYPQQTPTQIGIGVRVPTAEMRGRAYGGVLRCHIVGSDWQWDGSSRETVRFREDGYVENAGWTARGLLTRWDAVDSHTVILRVLEGRSQDLYAILLFADDFSSFGGYNFQGGSILAESHRLREIAVGFGDR